MTLLIIFLILFYVVWLNRARIQRYMARKAQERMEDYVRQATGMPPRDKTRKRSNTDNSRTREYPFGQTTDNVNPDSGLPREYAEDAEYVEYKEFGKSNDKVGTERVQYTEEHQVIDADWVEIKEKKSNE